MTNRIDQGMPLALSMRPPRPVRNTPGKSDLYGYVLAPSGSRSCDQAGIFGQIDLISTRLVLICTHPSFIHQVISLKQPT